MSDSPVEHFMNLPIRNTIQLEYVWIDSLGNTRSKSKSINVSKHDQDLRLDDVPQWNFDGSSTGQATGDNSEVYLDPIKLYKDPFRAHNRAGPTNWLVLCETKQSDAVSDHPTNTRSLCNDTLRSATQYDPWFGFEMEFFIINPTTGLPIGFKPGETAPEQGKFYCSANTLGRGQRMPELRQRLL